VNAGESDVKIVRIVKPILEVTLTKLELSGVEGEHCSGATQTWGSIRPVPTPL